MAKALRKFEEAAGQAPARVDPRADVMVDPLHPMHQDLLARITPSSTSASISTDAAMTRPPVMHVAFYAGIAAWGLVWLTVQAVSALL